MHYLYIKKIPKQTSVAINLKFLPFFLLFLGSFLILSVSSPIIFYQFFLSPSFSEVLEPVPSGMEVLGEYEEEDYTKISNWFINDQPLPPLPSKITHYKISIPKLKISDAVVQVGGVDLKESLIHYQGTAFPGQFGNTVIFGHSVLPQFFNPTNYLTIFSTLPTLKVKDEIFVDFDGVRYKYVVEELKEVSPSDISVLEQRYDDSYLTLITCVPPGTYLKRLAVRARLEKI